PHRSPEAEGARQRHQPDEPGGALQLSLDLQRHALRDAALLPAASRLDVLAAIGTPRPLQRWIVERKHIQNSATLALVTSVVVLSGGAGYYLGHSRSESRGPTAIIPQRDNNELERLYDEDQADRGDGSGSTLKATAADPKA